MSLDPAALEAAIRRADATTVRELLKGASDSDRRACAKALKPLLTQPGYAEDFFIFGPVTRVQLTDEQRQELAERQRRHQEQRRVYEEWRAVASSSAFQLARLGLAGGVKVALAALEDVSNAYHEFRARAERAAEILADWRPAWLAELIDRQLADPWGFGLPAWPLARALVLAGAIPRPEVAEYTTLMPGQLQRWEHDADGTLLSVPTVADALLADPGLLDKEVWRLFTVPEAGKALEDFDSNIRFWAKQEESAKGGRDQTWAEALALLSADGKLDRARLIDASVDAFTRDFNPNRVAWYAGLLAELEPSVDEVASRQARYLGLLGAPSKVGMKLAQDAASRLLDAGRLDPRLLLALSAPALLHPQKSIATTQLKLIGKIIAKAPEVAALGVATAAIAFGHQRQDVQEAALALITRHGLPDGAPLAEIRLRAMDLSPSLADQAAALGLAPAADQPMPPAADAGTADRLAELDRRIAAIPAARAAGLEAAVSLARSGEVPGPGLVRSGAGAALPEPVTDPEELVQLLSMLIEDARDAIAAERATAGAVRLCGLPERQRRQAVAPLLKRAAWVMNGDEPFQGDCITEDLALITCVWAGERIPPVRAFRDRTRYRPDQYVVDSKGRALTMTGIFTARAWEAARLIEAGRGGLLLAEPACDRGTITGECLLDRLSQLGRERLPVAGAWDRDAALLRLAPEAPADLWPAWSELDGLPAESLREAHLLLSSPLRFEIVVGKPPGNELSCRQQDELMLARIMGPVPAIAQCPSWRLLTRLADPIRDHAELIDAGLYKSHYDDVVASWSLMCPWQPDVAAAHLLRPLSARRSRGQARPGRPSRR